jgi:quinol-cytochrome oxidoreductase complex cytochrome b subunit
MILVLKPGIEPAELEEVLQALRARGIEGRVLRGASKPLVHLVSGPTRSARALLRLEQVEALVPTSGPRVRQSGRRFYPYHFVHLSAACLLLTGLLVLLAGNLPPGLGDALDAQHPPAQLAYPWFVRAQLAWVELFPAGSAWLGWLCLYALGLCALLLPLIDRSPAEAPARWPKLLGALVILAWLWMSFGSAIR